MKRIFISYSTEDYNKLKAIRTEINKNRKRKFEIIVVADRQNPGMPLSEKVKRGIERADYFVPILTRSSITNQWVNQEIGYAEAKGTKTVPIIESKIMNDLKGFIHNQLDLPFSFESFINKPRKEGLKFRKCYMRLLDHLN